jgi:hypothetical protein
MVAEDDPQFMKFWTWYPRRCAKKDARKAWAQLNPDAALVDRIVAALQWQVTAYEWNGAKAGYAPYPATWLNAERWTDERRKAPREAVLSDAVADPIRAWLEQKDQR